MSHNEEMMELFFSDTCLPILIAYFCRMTIGQNSDPITETVVAMISSPVSIMLTQVGIAPFKEHPSLVYPYRFLNDEQRTFLKNFVTYTQENAVGSIASVQVGGGCMLYRKAISKPVYLDPYRVISSLCQSIIGNRHGTEMRNRSAVCSIMLQRIGGVIHIDRAVMSKVGTYLQSLK
jgi:hypothetical protein